jgi:hypothetical protein
MMAAYAAQTEREKRKEVIALQKIEVMRYNHERKALVLQSQKD